MNTAPPTAFYQTAVLHWLLLLWSSANWCVLIAWPALQHGNSLPDFALHFPYVLIGLVILGGQWFAYRAAAIGHSYWFAGVLFTLATWF